MSWEEAINKFLNHLKIERTLSANTIDAYRLDIQKFCNYITQSETPLLPFDVNRMDVEVFLGYLHDLQIAPPSQARILAGIKAFYKYLHYHDMIPSDPTALITTPKLTKKLPDTLEVYEIEAMLDATEKMALQEVQEQVSKSRERFAASAKIG